MCGIIGLTHEDDHPSLAKNNAAIYHRGPDEEGEYFDPKTGVALAMRRLSIVDLAGGKQPMSNEDESIWVVCNGEIYNSPELRKYLIEKGHHFKSDHSDTEVLLHLYEEYTFKMLEKLNGMFGFVIYDRNRNILFGARDRMGIKPLYFTFKNGHFAFASELKSLLLLPWVSKDICYSSLYHYVSLQFVPAPNSIFSDIKKLPAGYYFIYDVNSKNLNIERYWNLSFAPDESLTIEDWKVILRSKIEEAIIRWTLSDVPIACSLSGGLDSSSIVGLLAQTGQVKIRTYTLGFEETNETYYNEIPLAKKVAEKWGTIHHELILDPQQLLNDLDKMVWHLDEPYAGGLPSWYVFNFISRDCKVAMTGTGGDELFGNYGKWKIYETNPICRHFSNLLNAIKWGNGREILDAMQFPHGHFYHRYSSDALKDTIIFQAVPEWIKKTECLLEELWLEARAEDARNSVAYVDFNMQLPEEFLLMTDRFSMAHSVEARVPFLDHELVELVFTIPSRYRTKMGDLKYLLREIVRDVLPQELLGAPKKGFILPLPTWTRQELRSRIENLLRPEFLKKQNLFSPQVWEHVVSPHLEGKKDHTQQVWTLFMFQVWHEIFIGN
jgi:asparagine synthase (glutamine-hydrolysing)